MNNKTNRSLALLGLDTLSWIEGKMFLIQWGLNRRSKHFSLENPSRLHKNMISKTCYERIQVKRNNASYIFGCLILPDSDTGCYYTLYVPIDIGLGMLEYLVNLCISQCIPGCGFEDTKAVSMMGCLKRNVVTKQGESNQAHSSSKLHQVAANLV